MRTCNKMRCGSEPVVTVVLAYGDRAVVIGDLTSEHDPMQLDLCRDHAGRMTPPLGWTVVDRRSQVAVAV
jgi:Protein of unknown function (DUF3499)